MSKLTARRGSFGRRLFWAGEYVGEAFKFTQAAGYGLHLKGVYWARDGSYNQFGGGTTRGFKLMREAIARAEEVLGEIRGDG